MNPAAALGTALLLALLFVPLVRTRSRAVRVLVLVGRAVLLALVPWLIPPERRIARFFVAITCGILGLEMWDLHVGAVRSRRPGFRASLAFLINPASLVQRRTGFERQPPPRRNVRVLARAVPTFAVALWLLFQLLDWRWTATPFLVEHLVKGLVFFVAGTSLFTATAAAVRLVGGYAPEPMQQPLSAVSPADFWRRYNRTVGEALREDVFRPLGGRSRPRLATLAVFAVSGLLHEYLFVAALGRLQGYQIAFFLLQGMAVAATLRWTPPRAVGVATTFTFNAVTSVLFFASFQGMVPHYPFYARGLPGWLW